MATYRGLLIGKRKDPLVDFWVFSGYYNSEQPVSIQGERGNALELHDFLFQLNSGFGSYPVHLVDVTETTSTITDETIIIQPNTPQGQVASFTESFTAKLLIEGLKGNHLTIGDTFIYQDCYIELPITETTTISVSKDVTSNIAITLLPDNPHTLQFNGQCFATFPKAPSLRDFTVLISRIPNYSAEGEVQIYKEGSSRPAFSLGNNLSTELVEVYGQQSSVEQQPMTVYLTRTSFNGRVIPSGTPSANQTLYLGKREDSYYTGAIRWFGLFNRTLTLTQIESYTEQIETEYLRRIPNQRIAAESGSIIATEDSSKLVTEVYLNKFTNDQDGQQTP